MKSEKAKRILDDGGWKVEVGCEDEEYELPYYAVKTEIAEYAIDVAEQEAEERMRNKSHKIIMEMMTGIFKGDMPQKIADEFIQKLNEE